jgi:hypothetical protein
VLLEWRKFARQAGVRSSGQKAGQQIELVGAAKHTPIQNQALNLGVDS